MFISILTLSLIINLIYLQLDTYYEYLYHDQKPMVSWC
jgi:hypothetical protein